MGIEKKPSGFHVERALGKIVGEGRAARRDPGGVRPSVAPRSSLLLTSKAAAETQPSITALGRWSCSNQGLLLPGLRGGAGEAAPPDPAHHYRPAPHGPPPPPASPPDSAPPAAVGWRKPDSGLRSGVLFPSLFSIPADVAKAAVLLGPLLPGPSGIGSGCGQGSLGWRAGDFRCCPLLLPTKPLVPVEDWPDLARLPGSVGCGWAVPRSNCPSRENFSLTELFCDPFVISNLGKKTKRSLTIL